jgi:hypothetical protein
MLSIQLDIPHGNGFAADIYQTELGKLLVPGKSSREASKDRGAER